MLNTGLTYSKYTSYLNMQLLVFHKLSVMLNGKEKGRGISVLVAFPDKKAPSILKDGFPVL